MTSWFVGETVETNVMSGKIILIKQQETDDNVETS